MRGKCRRPSEPALDLGEDGRGCVGGGEGGVAAVGSFASTACFTRGSLFQMLYVMERETVHHLFHYRRLMPFSLGFSQRW